MGSDPPVRAALPATAPAELQELQRLLEDVVGKIRRLLARRGLGPEADPSVADPLSEAQPLLAELAAFSVQGRAASGPRAGLRPRRLGDQVDPKELSGSVQGLAALDGTTHILFEPVEVCAPGARARPKLPPPP